MKRKYFTGKISNLSELRAEYRKQSKIYHPDNKETGSEAAFKEMQAEYEKIFKEIERGYTFEDQNQQDSNKQDFDINLDRKIREMLDRVINLDGLEIEISGCWIWLSGNTYIHRETIKSYGFSWSTSHKKWYWKPYDSRKPRRAMKEEDRRAKYGSMTFNSRPAASIGAA